MGLKYTMSHVPGNDLITVNALSQTCFTIVRQWSLRWATEFVKIAINSLPATERWLNKSKKKQLMMKFVKQSSIV